MPVMHRIFAVTCVALFLATLWMFYDDHFKRGWKSYQLTARQIEVKLGEWRKQQYETNAKVRERDAAERAHAKALATPVDDALLQEFENVVAENAAAEKISAPDFSAAKAANAKLKELSNTAEEKRQEYLAAVEKLNAAAAAYHSGRSKSKNPTTAEREADAKLKAAWDQALLAVRTADEASVAADAAAARERNKVLEPLRQAASQARFVEDNRLSRRKFKSADLDQAKATESLAIGKEVSERERPAHAKRIEELHQRVVDLSAELEELNLQYQAASVYRKRLDEILVQINSDVSATQKTLDDLTADLKRLEQARNEREITYGFTLDKFLGKRILTLPIIDAFGSPLKIENLWSEGNERFNNFHWVPRFDRCTTCHQAMEKSLPGEPTKPAFVAERELDFRILLGTSEEEETASSNASSEVTLVSNVEKSTSQRLLDELGLMLAGEGLINFNDVTISFVQPETPAASAAPQDGPAPQTMTAEELRIAAMVGAELPPQSTPLGLMVGDVIVGINGAKISSLAQAERILVDALRNKSPIDLRIRRGLPSPYTTHPRLDLFVGSLSPHPMGTFGCTVCHEGQGSATEFRFASHTPDSEGQMRRWKENLGWYDNHHWIFPMYPERFTESTCLKCHHDVVELDVSERYPDGAAPKVVQGHNLIQKNGCFGCHEINGFDGPSRRIGPDLRLEPNYFAAALGMLPPLRSKLRDAEAKLSEAEGKIAELSKNPDDDKADEVEKAKEEVAKLQTRARDLKDMIALAERVAASPENDAVRQRLTGLIEKSKAPAGEQNDESLISAEVNSLAELLKDQEAPGKLRKVGPSLRFVNSKLDGAFLFDWLRDPLHFRPSTRMPRFFELWSHLDPKKIADGTDPAVKNEPVEILSIATYLASKSQEFTFEEPPAGITESTPEEKAERGKWQFETRGCLACHSHKDFPEAEQLRAKGEILQGPDLSSVADKFSTEVNPVGKKWLYSWIKNPTRYHARTVMPDLQLDPIRTADRDEKGNEIAETVKVSDPVEDIVEYLLTSSSTGYKPRAGTLTQLDDETSKVLDQLTLEYLKENYDQRTATKYLQTGLPESLRGELKGAETELITADGATLTADQKLNYIGRKSIAKWGCYGCHDIPGFEDAKPIGAALADWGRKDPAKLAFEHIGQYLHGHHGHDGDHGGSDHGDDEEHEGDEAEHVAHGVSLPPAAQSEGPLPEFYQMQINAGNRIGFLFQKLREPRSYDYEKTEHRKYGERLRMPKFNFNDAEREAVATFVLGLVSEPPNSKYLYRPDPRSQALIEGRKVLDKFNCGGCHALQGDRWDITFPPHHFEEAAQAFDPATTFPFLMPEANSKEIAESLKTNSAGLIESTVHGLPVLSREEGRPVISDSEGDEIASGEAYDPRTLSFDVQLMSRHVLDGVALEPSAASYRLSGAMIDRHRPSDGGFLAKYLAPIVAEKNRDLGKGKEAWGWVPPPLVGEGHKVQSDWLHDFLLEPYAIRPAVVLRMPKFNMSSEEATALARYFAAVDNASFPNELVESRKPGYLEAKDVEYRAKVEATTGEKPEAGARLVDSMKMVTKLCSQCHLIGDFQPTGAPIAQAPNLAQVYRRLRPEYTRRWIANPNSILPYTGMPVNFPFDANAPNQGGMKDAPFHGGSIEQVDAVVDLLMNYDAYNQLKNPVSGTFETAPPTTEPSGDEDATESN